jgi:hypothetical protein
VKTSAEDNGNTALACGRSWPPTIALDGRRCKRERLVPEASRDRERQIEDSYTATISLTSGTSRRIKLSIA